MAGGDSDAGKTRIAALEAELDLLKESELLYRRSAELDGRQVWGADAKGRVRVMRAPFAAVTGRSEESAYGEGWLDVVHPDDRDGARKLWRKAVKDKTPYRAEFRARRADGSWRLMLSRAVPRKDEKGQVTGWSGTTEDIEERRLREADRHATAEKLRESEELHRYTLELGQQMAFTAAPDGRIFSISNRFWELTGLSPGMRPREGIHPDEVAAVSAGWEAAFTSGERYDSEFRMRVGDGYRYVRCRAAPLRGARDEILRWYGTIEDVQDQYEAAAVVRESEEMHRITLDLMRQIVWSVEPDGSGLVLSDRYRELTGMGPDSDAEMSIHPDDRPHILTAWGKALEGGEPLETECRLLLKDGHARYFRVRAVPRRDETGTITRWYGISEDIQDQKEAVFARQDVEERYRLATAATRDAVWDHDLIADVIDWSDGAAAILGSDEAIERTEGGWWGERLHPEDRDHVRASLNSAIAGSARHWSGTYRFRRDDGAYADIFDRGFIIRAANGVAVRAVGAMADLTERNRVEAEIRRMQAELIHVSRLSAMGTMASTLAHELNQPLTAVGNFIAGARRIAGKLKTKDPALGEALDAAEGGALRAAELVRRLRELVSRGTASMKVEPLATLIEDAGVLAFVDSDRRGIGHRVELSSEAQWVRADRVQIQQVLINLIRNAIEAMDGRRKKEILVSSRPAGDDMVEISVADGGPGLAGTDPDSLFSQFMTTKRGGMGLGLPISRTIIEAHGGTIWGEDRAEGGAVFRFTLPRAKPRRSKG